jgi:uncharacterized protein YdeI (YjbR/CyaY-like superfamily)
LTLETEIYKGQPVVECQTVEQWRDWLERNHHSVPSVWLKFAKKGSGAATVTYEEARDTAIAFGWIDGLINKLDDRYYLTRFTPRKTKSVWSKVNCAVAEQLIAEGAMHPAGLAHVDAAKADGRWDRAYDGGSTMVMSEDFQAALQASKAAKEFYDSLSAANRYSFLYRIQTSKTPEKRAANIAKFIEMLEQGHCFHPGQ